MFRAGQLVQFTVKGNLEKVVERLMKMFPDADITGITIQIKKDFDEELPEEVIGYDIVQEDTVIRSVEKSIEHLNGDSLSLVRIIKTLFDRRGYDSTKIFDVPELTTPIGLEYAVVRTFLDGYFFNTPEEKRKEDLLNLMKDKWEDLKKAKNFFDYVGKIFDVTLFNMV